MNTFSRAGLLAIITALSGVLSASAAEQKDVLPTAKEVLERYGREIGEAAFEKHQSQHGIGTIEMSAQKLSGKMEVFAARPNKLVLKVNLPGLGEVTTGYNGEIGWTSTAVTGPMLLEGKMAEEVKTQADFDHLLHNPKDYKVMEVLSKEEFNGEECYKLHLVHRSGFESTEYFSVKSGLQVGFTATQQTQFGPITATTIVSDYKKFGDILFPATSIQKASGIETLITIKEMDFDNVDPSVFALPPEVKTLLEQRKKVAEEKPAAETGKKKAI